jgi:glycosyltransferase involved in cell wall biosynthesis/GT2 family glycosyltransferase/tetratricopeptide (TPR) repeat protein
MQTQSPTTDVRPSHYVIFHKDHPFSPTGIHSGAEMATIHLARALRRIGRQVTVIGKIKTGSCEHDGVHYLDLGAGYDPRAGLSRLDGPVEALIAVTRADIIRCSLDFPSIAKRLLWLQDSDLRLTCADASTLNRLPAGIVYVSKALRRALQKQGLLPQKGTVIHNGFDEAIFQPRPCQWEPHRLAFAGALVAEKGVKLLIEAVNLLGRECPEAELWIHGSASLWGYDRPFLDTEWVSSTNFRIHFVGSVSQAQLAEAFSRSALTVVPSLPSMRLDPFPLTAVEAQACGCPVVVSTNGGLAESLIEGQTGYVFAGEEPERLASVLAKALGDQPKLKAMRAAALEHARQHFRWDDIAHQFVAAANQSPGLDRYTESVRTSPPPGKHKRLLVACQHLPQFDRMGGDFRLFQLVCALRREGHSVTLVARDTMEDPKETRRYAKACADLGIETHCLELVQRKNGQRCRSTIRQLADVIAHKQFDAAWVLWWNIALQFVPTIRACCPGIRVAVDSVDVAYLRELREAAILDDVPCWLRALGTRKQEKVAYSLGDITLAVTEPDEEVLLREFPGLRTGVVPNVHALAPAPAAYESRRDIGFVGFYLHPPNVDAAVLLAKEILPRIQRHLPDVKLHLIGNAPPPAVQALASPSVIVTGYVPDLTPYWQGLRVSVAPLRYGAGMKGKVGQAMAEGLPVVSTTIGAEGMSLTDGEHLLVRDDPQAFADAVVRLYTDPELWKRLAAAGHRVVAERWSETSVAQKLVNFLCDPASGRIVPPPVISPVVQETRRLGDLALGYDWLDHGFRATAEAIFRENVRQYPTFHSALIALAVLNCSQNRHSEAAKWIRQAEELAPESVGVLVLKGVIARQRGDTDLARKWLERAVQLHPTSHKAAFELAALHRDLNDLRRASQLCHQALQIRPGDLRSMLLAAEILVQGGDWQTGQNVLRTILATPAIAGEPALKQKAQELWNQISQPPQPSDASSWSAPPHPSPEPRFPAVAAVPQLTVSGTTPMAEPPVTPGSSLVSIILLAHNQLDHTRRCLESIERHTPEPHELILVDNGSTDGTLDHFHQYSAKHENVRLIVNRTNHGFAAGNNHGLALARGDFVLLLNNDTVAAPGWLTNMLAVFAKHSRTGIVGPRSNFVLGKQVVEKPGYRALEELPAFASEWAEQHAGQSRKVDRVIGFCLLARRAVLDAVGGLDEQFGSGNLEDDDFCIRAHLAGFETRIADDAFIHHVGNATFNGARIDYRQAILTNWELFKRKWGIPVEVPPQVGYLMPAALPAGMPLKTPLPELQNSHELSSDQRCWTEKGLSPATTVGARKKQPVPPPPCAQLGHLGEARELLRQKNLQAAWEATVAAIQQRPFHPEAFLLLAEIALAAGDSVSARQCAQAASDLAPGWKAPRQFLQKSIKGNTRPVWLKLPPGVASDPSTIHHPPSTRLTVCIIAKNEEKFLERCLDSVKPIAHQVIVVDTGSADRTVEIAKSSGAEVHSFAWCDDFSAARNAALEHATGDWVLILDADEELPGDQHARLKTDLKNSKAIAYRLPLMNQGLETEGVSYVPRLFRNAPGAYFHGCIHEQVFPSLIALSRGWGLQTGLGTAQILHHGYRREVLEDRNKVERNLRLLHQAVQESPNDANLVMNLGLELVRSGNLADGLTHYREAFQLMSAQPPAEVVPELREVLLTQFTCHLYKQREHAEIVRVLTSPLAKNGGKNGGLTASLHFALGLSHFELKQYREAADQMRRCLSKRKEPALSPLNADIMSAAPHHCLALSLAKLGDAAGAEKAFEAALKETGRVEESKLDYARFLTEQDRQIDALHRLHELVARDSGNITAWRLGGEIALSRRDFLEFAYDWTGEALRCLPDDPAIIAQRAEVLLLRGETADARPLWEKACNGSRPPRALAALIICAAAELQPMPPTRDAGEEAATSRAFVQWYQRLLAFGVRQTIERLNSQLDAFRESLPTAAQVLDSALAEARGQVA